MRGTGPGCPGSGSGKALVIVAAVSAGLVISCSAEKPGDSEKPESDRSGITIGATAKETREAPVLRWKGSWRWNTSQDPIDETENTKVRVGAELRALPAGDVYGTFTADGHTATVVHVDHGSTYLKADRAMWKEILREGGGRPGTYGDRWVELEEPEVLGLELSWLSPRERGTKLGGYRPAGKGGPWKPARTVPERFSRPSGVQADALAFLARPGHSEGAEGAEGAEGVYWVDAERPRRLLGYTGRDAAGQTDPDSEQTDPAAGPRAGMMELSVREEDASRAKRTYAELESKVEGLGGTVPVAMEPGDDDVPVEAGEEACGPECYSVTVPVTVRNKLSRERVRPRVEVTLSGVDPFSDTPPESRPVLGSCEAELPEIRPSKKATAACAVTGGELRKAVDKAGKEGGYVKMTFDVETGLSGADITAPSGKDEVKKVLRENAAGTAG